MAATFQPKPHNYQDLTGLTFRGLEVIESVGVDSGGHVRWRCRREDGSEVVRNGSYLQREEPDILKSTWWNMIARCTNPKNVGYVDYGGRGVRVCDAWLASYEAFASDMGSRPSPRHSLDRIDVNGDYEPGNCRWATREEQARNTRAVHLVTYREESLSVAEWSERLGIKAGTLDNRLRQGRPLEEVFYQGRLPQPPDSRPRKFAARHGKSKTREYQAWNAMLNRCTKPGHPAWRDYGGRGIVVDPRWQDFLAFLGDMGPCPEGFSLDRIDVNGGYEPKNCRWASPIEQANNVRSNRRLTLGGRTQTLAQWARELGVPYETLRSRLRQGWAVERVLSV